MSPEQHAKTAAVVARFQQDEGQGQMCSQNVFSERERACACVCDLASCLVHRRIWRFDVFCIDRDNLSFLIVVLG